MQHLWIWDQVDHVLLALHVFFIVVIINIFYRVVHELVLLSSGTLIIIGRRSHVVSFHRPFP